MSQYTPVTSPAPSFSPYAAGHDPSILAAHGLLKSYGRPPQTVTRALAGVDLRIAAGESVAIMGASGSGKTTLLHCLAGIVAPDGGSIRFTPPSGTPVEIAGMPESERSRLRREAFGFVFQQGLLVPELTAVENVALALMVNGMRRAQAEQYATSWLGDLGLAGMEQRRIGQLSGGQAQRVAIARALVTGAPVLFADEPTGALDSRTSGEVMDALLRATTAHGRTLVVVTHDPEVAARCSRVIHMVDGRVLRDEPAAAEPSAALQALHADRAAHPAHGPHVAAPSADLPAPDPAERRA